MQGIGMRGSIAAIIGGAAVLLVIFTINAGMIAGDTSGTFTKMQAYREATEKTEQAIRVLDKATAEKVYSSPGTSPGCIPSIPDTSYLSTTRLQFNAKNNVVSCSIASIPALAASRSGSTITITGKIECSLAVDGITATTARNFQFKKTSFDNAGNCQVKDEISQCTEQPTLSCP